MDQIPYLQYSIQYHHEIFKLLYPAWSITALHGSLASSYASVSNEGVYTVYQCAYVNSSIINNCQSYQCKNLFKLTFINPFHPIPASLDGITILAKGKS